MKKNYKASFYGVCESIRFERNSQDIKWGVQNHSDYLWLTILMEEVGELAKTMLDREDKGHPMALRNKELIQIAAVCVAWMECLARKGKGARMWKDEDYAKREAMLDMKKKINEHGGRLVE